MQLLVYLFVYPLIFLISLLPFRLLYLLSDFVYFVLYYIIGYRKKTVRYNLELALPHLSGKERLSIEKKSFRHLCDMFLEMIKTMSITRKQIDKRFTYTNFDEYLNLEKKGKSIALMCPHYASYEWVISLNHYASFSGFAIYKKIANPYFDKLVKNIRAKFGAHLITTKETSDTILNNEKNNLRGAYGFASDQSPKLNKAQHWVNFMGIEVPAYTGAEFLSKKYDMNVIFLKVKKLKRGYYQATFEVPFDDVQKVPDYEITDLFFKGVEQQILDAPEYYLWTHKRWKHQRK